MNISLNETQCEEVIESIRWIAEEYDSGVYDEEEKYIHKDIRDAFHLMLDQLNEYRRTNEV